MNTPNPICRVCHDAVSDIEVTYCDACSEPMHLDCACHRKATFATPEGSFCEKCTGGER